MRIGRLEVRWHISKKRQQLLDKYLNEYMAKLPLPYNPKRGDKNDE